MTGFIVFGHGSSVESANDAVRAVAADMAERSGHVVETAFLEGGRPDLAGGIARLVERGASRVVVLPYFLTLGLHLQRDLPRIVAGLKNIYVDVEIDVAPPLDGHPALVRALLDRATESA